MDKLTAEEVIERIMELIYVSLEELECAALEDDKLRRAEE